MSTDPSFFDSLDAPESELPPSLPEPAAEPEPAAAVPEPARPSPVPATIEGARDPLTGRFTQAPEPAQPAVPAPAVTPPEPAKVIPLAAHLEERARWKAEMKAMEDRLARLEKPAEPPAPEPDFVTDPKGYVDAKTERALAALKQVEERLEPVQQATELQQFLGHVAAVEGEFVRATPDYYDALAHVRQVRASQLAELFPSATQAQIAQQLLGEEVSVAHNLVAQGRNPAETVYRLARTYGFVPKPAATPAPAASAAPAVPAVPKAPVADPTATLGSLAGSPAVAEEDDLAGIETAEDMLKVALRERFRK